MRKLFVPFLFVAMIFFAFAPVMIAWAPPERTMGLIQKIFYFHVPSAMAMFVCAFICGISGAVYLFGNDERADRIAFAAAELTIVFGVIVLLTGPIWARKAWGVWWQWDARLTSTLILWLIFIAYLMLRRFGGPGSSKLAAGIALFGMANVPFVYWSVNVWRTLHPKTSVVMTLGPGMRGPFWWSVIAFMIVMGLTLAARVKLEHQRAKLDDIFLALED